MFAAGPQWESNGKLYPQADYNPAVKKIVKVLAECNVPIWIGKEILREAERTAECAALVIAVDE